MKAKLLFVPEPNVEGSSIIYDAVQDSKGGVTIIWHKKGTFIGFD